MSISIDIIPNRQSPPAVLLRESWREGKRIRRRTLANLSKVPASLVDDIRVLLKGGKAVKSLDDTVSIKRSLPHGHVGAVIGMTRKIGLERILDRNASRMRDLALASIIARVLEPLSKLACARELSSETASSSLNSVLPAYLARSIDIGAIAL